MFGILTRVLAQEWHDPTGQEPATIKDLEVVFARIISIVASVVSFVLFIMLLIGGFKFLTSGGDPKKTESAKGTMTYAIVGLVVIIASYLILKVIEALTGVPLTRFEIPIYTP